MRLKGILLWRYFILDSRLARRDPRASLWRKTTQLSMQIHLGCVKVVLHPTILNKDTGRKKVQSLDQTKKKNRLKKVGHVGMSGRTSCVSAGKASVSKCNLTPALSWRLPCTRSSPQSWSPADTQIHHQCPAVVTRPGYSFLDSPKETFAHHVGVCGGPTPGDAERGSQLFSSSTKYFRIHS